jgi:hypothetical protein
MTIRTALAIFASSILAIDSVGATTAWVPSAPSTVVEFSAQTDANKNKSKKPKNAERPAVQQNQRKGNQNVQRQNQRKENQNVQRREIQRTGNKKTTTKKTITTTTTPKGASKTIAPAGAGAKSVTPKAARVVTPKGTRAVTAGRFRGLSASGAGRASVRGRNFSTWRGGRGYRARHGNAWVTFVPLAVLAGILIGENHYYPYAYISAPQDYCDGLTEDGCQLMWDDVETVEGDVVGQCVAYCPWQD